MTIRGEGDWEMAGGDTAVAYLKPEYNRSTARARLREMERRGAQSFISDLNCHGKGKDR